MHRLSVFSRGRATFAPNSHRPCPISRTSPAGSSVPRVNAPMAMPAVLATSSMAPSARQGAMPSLCLQLATRVSCKDHRQVPSARLHGIIQQDAQGPLASSEGLVNPGLNEPAELLDGSEAFQNLLDEQQLEAEPYSGHQATAQLLPITIPCKPPDPPCMQPAAGMQLMKQAISMMEGTQPRLPDMSDDEWLAFVHSFLLPLQHFRAGFISTRLEVWQYFFQHFGMTAKAKKVLGWLQHGLDIH